MFSQETKYHNTLLVCSTCEGKQKIAVIVLLHCSASATPLATDTEPQTECATSDHNQGFYSAGWQACHLACFLQPSHFAGYFLAFKEFIKRSTKNCPQPYPLFFPAHHFLSIRQQLMPQLHTEFKDYVQNICCIASNRANTTLMRGKAANI